jgi:hypothetical protein
MAFSFEVLEERQDNVWSEIIEGNPVDGDMPVLKKELQEEPERVAIGADGMPAQVALRRKIIGEKLLEQ